MSDYKTRPTRRELRLARLAEEARQSCTDTASRTTVVMAVPEDLHSGDHAGDLPELDSNTFAMDNAHGVDEQRRVRVPQLYASLRHFWHQSKNRRAFASASCAFVIAIGGGLALGSYGFETHAQANSAEGEFAGEEIDHSQTPATLRSLSGAADSARFKAYQEQFSGHAVVCETVSSANSLTAFARNDLDKFIHPLAAGTFSEASPFGWRIHPIYGTSTLHEGVDFSAALGTPIYAIADGKVVFSGSSSITFGDPVVIIEHEINGEKFTSWYLHSYASGIHVSEGDSVRMGDHIADVGNAGRSTGPHLHFEIHPGAFSGFDGPGPVDPMTFMKEKGAVDINDVCGAR
ncbi:M23 family metallopeptidase [Arcanobacterium pinnipediorum]|uniref:M23 family metallopeptidase n=1 Tax=Arcanobacterium pinnipediorum TaxID=1503041 RepID=A0ABY5AHZ0_9ACTO|nr:M23 family metallopeptidase [Arcanobacterium pinnipediorum]USR79702.1 M23 family metallopeptidase [Arcanobacterium pinnipediorum]